MPYKRRYRRYKRKCKTPMFGKADRYVARKALTLGKYAVSMLNVEKKYKDTILAHAPGTGGVINSLSTLSQGDTTLNRDGNQVKWISCLLRWQLKMGSGATNTLVRFIIGLDKQPNGASPAVLDVLETNSPLSPLEKDNALRFKIFYDKMIPLSIYNNIFSGKKYKKLNFRTRYNGNTGGLGDINTNNMFVLSISDVAINNPTLDLNFRMRFVDN